jgi:hypothetical protein
MSHYPLCLYALRRRSAGTVGSGGDQAALMAVLREFEGDEP